LKTIRDETASVLKCGFITTEPEGGTDDKTNSKTLRLWKYNRRYFGAIESMIHVVYLQHKSVGIFSSVLIISRTLTILFGSMFRMCTCFEQNTLLLEETFSKQFCELYWSCETERLFVCAQRNIIRLLSSIRYFPVNTEVRKTLNVSSVRTLEDITEAVADLSKLVPRFGKPEKVTCEEIEVCVTTKTSLFERVPPAEEIFRGRGEAKVQFQVAKDDPNVIALNEAHKETILNTFVELEETLRTKTYAQEVVKTLVDDGEKILWTE